MRNRNHARAWRQQLLEFVELKIAIVVNWRPFDHRALAFAQKVPWHDIGMVLHDGEDDFITGLDTLAPERVSDKIDRLGGVAGKDDFFLATGVQKCTYCLARTLVGLGCLVCEIVETAMHVRILLGVGFLQSIYNFLWLLRPLP